MLRTANEIIEWACPIHYIIDVVAMAAVAVAGRRVDAINIITIEMERMYVSIVYSNARMCILYSYIIHWYDISFDVHF